MIAVYYLSPVHIKLGQEDLRLNYFLKKREIETEKKSLRHELIVNIYADSKMFLLIEIFKAYNYRDFIV